MATRGAPLRRLADARTVYLTSYFAELLRLCACFGRQEDVLLRRLIKEHGVKKWSSVAEGISGRSGKSCRLR